MKNILILPFLILSLNAAAQMDTAYLPPFAFLTYDAKEWDIRQSENDRYSSIRLDGKIDKGFEIKIRLNIGDTLITKENLLASLEKRSPYGRELVVEKLEEKGDFFLGVFSFSQDECSRDDIPIMFKSMKFRAAFRIIENTNLLIIEIDDDSFLFPEDVQTSKIQSVIDGINVITPQQLDQLLDLPMTAQKAQEVVNATYNKSYNKYFDFNISKRKCFDDSYFYDELNGYYELKEIDSLLRYATDSVLCDIVAFQQASDDSTEMADRLRQQVEIGFNYAERTELFYKAQKEAFTLFDYLDFQLNEAQTGPIQRLVQYSAPNESYDSRNKYSKIINQQFAKQYLREYSVEKMRFQEIGEHKYLVQVEAYLNDTIAENFYYHLEKTNDSYQINKILLPEEFANTKKQVDFPSTDNIEYENIPLPPTTDDYLFFQNNFQTISPSPKNQFLALYEKGTNDIPKYISLGNTKNIVWIPLEPAILDTSKYLLIINDYPVEEYNTTKELYWNEFNNLSEKKRLNEIFISNHAMTIDSALIQNTLPTNDLEEVYSISVWNIKSFIADNTHVKYIAYESCGIADLDNDGKEDIYNILYSNGKVISAKAYLLKDNSYKVIGTKAVVKLLKNNTGFINQLISSQIGNHGTNEITDDSDLYKISTK